MSVRVCVGLFVAILIGFASTAELKESEDEQKTQSVDNTLYAKYICLSRYDGEKMPVPGKCSEFYECSKGKSLKKSCRNKFFEFELQKCVWQSDCVEVDYSHCIKPTKPPCSGNVTPSPPPTCQCPTYPETPTPTPPQCPMVTCFLPPCPTAATCPPRTICTSPPPCPTFPPYRTKD